MKARDRNCTYSLGKGPQRQQFWDYHLILQLWVLGLQSGFSSPQATMPEGCNWWFRETPRLDCSAGRRKYWLGSNYEAHLLEGQSRLYLMVRRLGMCANTGHLDWSGARCLGQAFGKRLRGIPRGLREVAGELNTLKRSGFLVNRKVYLGLFTKPKSFSLGRCQQHCGLGEKRGFGLDSYICGCDSNTNINPFWWTALGPSV
jgi:hypothetical protein